MKTETDRQTVEYFDPKRDFVFKRIFGSAEDEDISLAFLNEILRETGQKPLTSITFVDRKMEKTMENEKECILDILGDTDDGRQINVEIQVSDENNMIDRSIYYCCKTHSKQLVKGQDYETAKKTICINILDFTLLPHDAYHSYYHFYSEPLGHRLTDKVEIHYVELPKLTPTIDSPIKKERWLSFLSGKIDPSDWEEFLEECQNYKKQ